MRLFIIICSIFGVVLVSGCANNYGLRRSASGTPFDASGELSPQSKVNMPYVTKYMYGELCVNSKLLGRDFCFPCYSPDKGGCEAVAQELLEKAVSATAPVGPVGQTGHPAYTPNPYAISAGSIQQVPQIPVASPYPAQSYRPFTPTSPQYPQGGITSQGSGNISTYPNFAR